MSDKESLENLILSATSALSTMSAEQKIFALSRLTQNLTIGGRNVYSERFTAPDTIEKFYTINEMLHRVSNQLMHLSSGDDKAEPDETLIDSLYHLAREGRCEVELMWALKYSFRPYEETRSLNS